MSLYCIAVIPWAGAGVEVLPGGLRTIEQAAAVIGSFAVDLLEHPWSCEILASRRCARLAMGGLEAVARSGPRPADFGGRANTREVDEAITNHIRTTRPEDLTHG